jgi:hypothetical protein
MPDPDLLDDPVGRQALDVLRPLLLAPILAHSIRTLHLARAESRARGWYVDPVDLVVACLFHDSGTIPDRSAERFEVTGADRATAFAREAGRDDGSCRAIWDAVALHTSPHIAERHEPLTRAVRSGVLADFGNAELVERHRALVTDLEQRHPRDGIERVLAGAVVDAARTTPAKAPPASWPAELVRGAATTSPGSDNPGF